MVWVGTFKDHPVQPLFSEQVYLQLDQAAQSPVRPGLECFQGWGISHLSGQPGPVFLESAPSSSAYRAMDQSLSA